MTLKDEDKDKDEVIDLVRSIIVPILEGHVCKSIECPIPQEQAKEVGHLLGVVVDLGDGDMRQGIEVTRNHHTFVRELMMTKKKIVTVITTSIIVSLVSGFLALIFYAIKESIQHLKP